MHMTMRHQQQQWYFNNSWRQLRTMGSGGTGGGGWWRRLMDMCGCGGSGGWRWGLSAVGVGGRRRRWQQGDCLSMSCVQVSYALFRGARDILFSWREESGYWQGHATSTFPSLLPHNFGCADFLCTSGHGKSRVQNLNSNPEGMTY